MELRDYLRGLRRHWLAIFLMTAVGLAMAFAWYSVQTPVYQATAIGVVQTLEIADENEANQNLVGAYDGLAAAKVATYMDMATWKIVADEAIDELGLDISANQAVSRISLERPASTNNIRVTATGASPEQASALAQAWLAALVVAIDDVEGDGTPGSAPINITTYESAGLSSSPIFPNLTTSLLVGALIGIGAGIAFALMRTASDRRIRAAEDVEARLGLPVVGTIPATPHEGEGRLFDPSKIEDRGVGFAVAEALRALRTNLQFMDVDNPPRTIVVTSPVPGDGKSTIACNLAVALASSGKRVVLMDGDLRRSTVAQTMGLPGGAGLTDVLAGRAVIADVLQRSALSENLFVLTAGSTPPNPSEVLGSERMHHLIGELTEHAMVVIDAPPLLPVTDGAVLTHQADGALLVVGVGKTTFDLVEKAVDILGKAGGRTLGVVLNRVPLKGSGASSYSYEYRRDYGPKADAGARGSSTSPSSPTDPARADEDAVGADAEKDGSRQPLRRA